MGEKLSLVAGPKAALASPSDFSLPLRNLHVGEHPGGGWWPLRGCRHIVLTVAGDMARQGLKWLKSGLARKGPGFAVAV